MTISKHLKLAMVLASALFLHACGGGGSSTVSSSSQPPAETVQTTLTGVVSKGPVANATVNIFAVSNGVKGTLLKTANTDGNGAYSAGLGSYTGPVIIEVSDGSYTDEATGEPKTLAAPLRAVFDNAQGTFSLPVTPLTELAVRKAGTLTTANIKNANTMISDLFKVDIINTVPLAPTSNAMSSATQAQKDYTLALATVSQISKDSGKSLDSSLTTLAQGISAAGMTSGTAAAIQSALTAFVSPSNTNNKTGISDTTTTNLVNIGATTKSYKMVLKGNFAASAIKGIQFDLLVPTVASLRIDSSNAAVLASSLVLSGGAPSGTLLAGKFSAGVLTTGIITTTGLSAGEFATLTCDVAAGKSAPAVTAFIVKNLRAIDAQDNVISGVTVSLN